jgi:hypothetical protein
MMGKLETSIQPLGSEKSISHTPLLFSLMRAWVCEIPHVSHVPVRQCWRNLSIAVAVHTATHIPAALTTLDWKKRRGKNLARKRCCAYCYIILCYSSSLKCEYKYSIGFSKYSRIQKVSYTVFIQGTFSKECTEFSWLGLGQISCRSTGLQKLVGWCNRQTLKYLTFQGCWDLCNFLVSKFFQHLTFSL